MSLVAETYSQPSPFFEHNHNLHSFEIGGFDLNTRNSRLRVSALSKRNKTTLRTIGFNFTGTDDESAAELIASLALHHNLSELSLKFADFERTNCGRKWCVALGNLLKNQEIQLEKLTIRDTFVDDEGATIWGMLW